MEDNLQEQVSKIQRRFDDFKEDWEELKHWIREFKNSTLAYRGLDGEQGPQGPSGKNAVIKIVQRDGRIQILDPNDGKVVAELVSIPGPAGKDGKDGEPGESIKGDPGAQGESGRDGLDGQNGQNGKDGADGYTPTTTELERLIAEALLSAALKHQNFRK
jgi:hypothetical protein